MPGGNAYWIDLHAGRVVLLVGVGEVDDFVALVPLKYPDNDAVAVATGTGAVVASEL